jgi:membrane-associated phospholipid phosphatase
MTPIFAYLGAEFQVFAVRQVIHRPRPLTANWPQAGSISGIHETSLSFPSGHAVAVSAVLFTLLGTLALVRHWWWPWIVALVLALFVAATRLVLGVHWFSDVALGVLVGSVWGIAVAAIGVHLSWEDLRDFLPSHRDR